MSKKEIKVFWFKRPRPGNFGDILTPYILSYYGYDAVHCPIDDAEYICVGSIAKIATEKHTVLGSGAMNRTGIINPKANWVWVRGPITKKIVVSQGATPPEVYGDPALLLPRIYPVNKPKKHSLGIIPHYVDYEEISKQYPSFLIINLLNSDIEEVIEQITDCEKIISSSLHGIIVAHAYGIPAAWAKFSDKLSGDDTKFYDHYEFVNAECIPSNMDSPLFTTADFDDTEMNYFLKNKNL